MKITGIDLNLFSVFDSVVRNGGFSAAQHELGLSQPTISNHIKALEERLGVKLCQRGRRGFMLTEKGRIVHQLGQSLLVELDMHASKLAELKGSRNVSTTLRQWHLDFKLDFLRLALVG